MRRRASRIAARCALVVALAASAAGAAATPVSATSLTRTESSFLRSLNAVRARHGLRSLRADNDLIRASRAHTADMIHRRYFAHGPFVPRLQRFGAHGRVGEVLAWGVGRMSEPDFVVGAWLRSGKHRVVLLHPGFRAVGIGVRIGPFRGWKEATVVTVDFEGN